MRQDNETTFRTLIDRGFNRGELDVVDEIVAPEFVEHQFSSRPHPPGPAAVKAIIGDIRRMMPDAHLAIEDVAVAGDKVWARIVATGTAAGTPVRIDVIDVARFMDGKMIEHWGVPDRFAMLVQTGALGR